MLVLNGKYIWSSHNVYICKYKKFKRLYLVNFITNRLRSSKNAEFSRPAIRIAVISVALSICVMILSVAIVKGFQREIREKVCGFAGNIQVNSFDNNSSYELQAFHLDSLSYSKLENIPGVENIQGFALKAGIIKTTDQIEGIVLKGVGTDYNWDFFKDCLVEGRLPDYSDTACSNEALISRETALRLNFNLNDPLRIYFINPGENIPRGRKLKISGIYDSGMGEFDKLYIIGNIGIVRKLNNWDSLQVGGYEILVKNFNEMPGIYRQVYYKTPSELNARSINEMYPNIFDWLSLLDANVVILLILMTIVASVSMISALLIIVLERTNMIGILKAIGSDNRIVRRIFLRLTSYILLRGFIAGNIIGLGLGFLQQEFSFVKLPQESYYVSHVPVYFDFFQVLWINMGAFAVCFVILILPVWLITRVSPLKSIRFD